MDIEVRRPPGLRLWAVLLGLALLVYSSAVVFAQEGEYANRSPHLCGNCHEDEYDRWVRSDHGRAYDDEVFQAAWERARQAEACLSCHSPSYGPVPGAWAFAGVGCGACHRTIDDTRREGDGYYYHGTMNVLSSAADCAGCHGADHALTYREWELSAHNGPRVVDCFGCHEPHSTGINAVDGATLCGSCHLQEAPTTNPHMHQDGGCTDCHPAAVHTDNIHMQGAEPAADCIACHMVTEPDRYGRYLSNAGHTMQVELAACTNCHGDLHALQSDTLSPGG